MSNPQQTIRMVSKHTGLSPHLIRIWERRYSAVKPTRTPTNRRTYSDEQIQRLTLLGQLTRADHSIGEIANLPIEELHALVEAEGEKIKPVSAQPPLSQENPTAPEFVEAALQAVRDLNAESLEQILERASVEMGGIALLQNILVPLIEEIGQSWRDGRLKIAHEHIATAVIRTFLGNHTRQANGGSGENSPHLLVTTPVGQLHELGAILAAAAAGNHGWRVTYLGPNLPAEEIAGAVSHNQARAVALSLVYPEDDPRIDGELSKLRRLLPADTAILIGGRAAPSYEASIQRIKAPQFQSLAEFHDALENLRKAKRPAAGGKAA